MMPLRSTLSEIGRESCVRRDKDPRVRDCSALHPCPFVQELAAQIAFHDCVLLDRVPDARTSYSSGGAGRPFAEVKRC